jgi:hypothetical protein
MVRGGAQSRVSKWSISLCGVFKFIVDSAVANLTLLKKRIVQYKSVVHFRNDMG